MEIITIESRPRLQSCNIFVSLLNGIDPSSIQVKLSKDSMTLRVGKSLCNLSLSTIRVVPTSLSCLRVAGCWLSFRIQTSPLDSIYGTFGTELVDSLNLKNDDLSVFTNSRELPPKGVDLSFSCSCCENIVTRVFKLKKVLPLPSNDCDPADFFCCTHSHEDYSKLLEPKDSDYFYGSHYAVMNRENFSKNLKIDNESVVCNRCFAVIGIPNTDLSLKIWNCCIEYSSPNDGSVKSKKCSNPLSDFKAAVKNSYSDGFTNNRILLEAKEGKKTHYLLLKPMEWNLELLTEPSKVKNTKDVTLMGKKVVKVLYDYGETRANLNNDSNDAKHLRVGLKSMVAGMEHLLSSSKRIPPIYRNCDDYHIGYINLEMSDKV